VVDREERRIVIGTPISFSITVNKQILQNMKKLIIIIIIGITSASCKSTKYVNCDAYKTHYKPVKADKHKHHKICDAYN
jgi:hypothetical protein